MSTVFERLAPEARVAVIRLRSLGDCVLTTPALSLLKQARPDLRIGVVVEDAFAPVFAGNPDVDCILRPKASEISRWRPHLALNLHGGATSVRLTLASRALLRAGFNHFRFRPIYNVRIPRAQEILHVHRKVHTAEHLASASFFLGAPVGEIPRARLFAKHVPRPRPHAVLHPMASAPSKIWPYSNFLAIADHIEHRLGLEPVFISGRGESLAAFNRYTSLEGASLEEIKSLLAGAALFIGNDSGPAHMAAAFGIPVVVMFGSSDPDIWRPWRTESSVLTSPDGIQFIGIPEALRAIQTVRVPNPQPLAPQLSQ
jgi:ADP-heptose:LPS heptosyltransferase